MKAVVLQNLSKIIDGRDIFRQVSFSFPHHGLIAVVGESGCGKSTLLDVIAGIDVSYETDGLKRKESEIKVWYQEEQDRSNAWHVYTKVALAKDGITLD